jgi:hypothetical protein
LGDRSLAGPLALRGYWQPSGCQPVRLDGFHLLWLCGVTGKWPAGSPAGLPGGISWSSRPLTAFGCGQPGAFFGSVWGKFAQTRFAQTRFDKQNWTSSAEHGGPSGDQVQQGYWRPCGATSFTACQFCWIVSFSSGPSGPLVATSRRSLRGLPGRTSGLRPLTAFGSPSGLCQPLSEGGRFAERNN